MTNEQIIFNERLNLLEAGIIKGTGRKMILEYEDGTKREIEEPEAIHTFVSWKEHGRQVKKGEHAIATIVIWKQGKGKTDEETGEEKEGRMFMKKAFFFTEAQTEPAKQ